MGNEDLALQQWLMDASFLSWSKKNRLQREPADSASNYLEVATELGNRLVATAIHGDDDSISWLALKYLSNEKSPKDGQYQTGLVEYDLYSGLTGVILFLAYLTHVTGNTTYRKTAESALSTLEAKLAVLSSKPGSGGYNGLGSQLFLYSHLAVLWKSPALRHKAHALLVPLRTKIENETGLDIIAGTAGGLLALLSLLDLQNTSEVENLAIACGDKLLKFFATYEAAPMQTLDARVLPYPRGFAHGLSGLAFALARLSRRTGISKYQDAAIRMLDLERAFIGEDQWTDIPGNEKQAAWCHGAAGIALARMGAYQTDRSARLRLGCEVALNYLVQQPDLDNHTLCHGSIGNLDPLIVASEVFSDDPRWVEMLKLRGESVLKSIRTRGLSSPLPGHLIEPGMMMGLSGMGLGMLRLARPDLVPSVLTLDPPKKDSI